MSVKGWATMQESREDHRGYRRLTIQLPVECISPDGGWERTVRGVTVNISTGGIYFEVDVSNGLSRLPADALLDIELTVPPGQGHFPYEGRVKSVAEVVRWEELGDVNGVSPRRRRVGVAARFREPLKLAF